MRRLWPDPADDIDPLADHLAIDRAIPAGRPWVMTDMVSTLDGAYALGETSTGIGGAGDRTMFHALRSMADVIMAGAGTVRAEGYGPAKPTAEVRAGRVERGQQEVPPVAVVSASLYLDPTTPLFTDAVTPTIVITHGASDADRRHALSEVAQVIVAGDDDIDLAVAMAALGEHGDLVLCEGGPTLNAGLIAAGVLDELAVTVSAKIAGTGPHGIVGDVGLADPLELELTHAWMEGRDLMMRVVRP